MLRRTGRIARRIWTFTGGLTLALLIGDAVLEVYERGGEARRLRDEGWCPVCCACHVPIGDTPTIRR